jgi:fermentation-respiration switch protein FrsA (DUF1100 family)
MRQDGVVVAKGALMRPALIVVVVLVVLLGALWLGQRRLIYLPDTSAVPRAADVLTGGRDVVLTTSDGLDLGSWLVAPTGVDRRLAVLLAPGNGGNRLGRLGLARALSAEGFTVLVMDYRGYGGNPGSPTEAGLLDDARAARGYLVEVLGWPGRRLIYLGESMGSAVVARLAVEHPPGGLVLRSPFVDLAAAGAHNYPMLPVRLLLRDRLPVADLVATVRVPTVVVYGTADSIIPPEQSRQVAARAAGPVTAVAIEGADHNDPILVQGRPFIDAIAGLAERIAT